MRCENCATTYIEEFDFGTTCEGLRKCPNCGCNEAKTQGIPTEKDNLDL